MNTTVLRCSVNLLVFFFCTRCELIGSAAHHFPTVSELLLCDGQVRLLVQHLFDILNGCEGGDPERPRPDVVVINGQTSQPEKNQEHKYWREEKKDRRDREFWKKRDNTAFIFRIRVI